jgi:1-acyl-sn-glycerol-3-phosphate acyltransferase
MLGAIMYGFIYGLIHFLRLIGLWRWRVEGLEQLPPREMGGMIIAMNHVHWLDILAIGGMLPFRYRLSWLAKSELFKNQLVAWWLTEMQVIAIKRGKRDLAALDTAVDALKGGAVLLVYPEGHRSRTGVLQPGRGGAIRVSMQSGTPIVPVAISGTEHGLLGSFTRKPVVVRIGKPFTISPTPDGKIPPDMMDQLTTDMMSRIASMLPEPMRGPYQLEDKK